MMNLACQPAASSTRVCGGHFRTPTASLITNVTYTKRHWTSKHKSRSKPLVHLWPICLHINTQRRTNVWQTERENRTRFLYLKGEAARRKLHAETSLLLLSRLGTLENQFVSLRLQFSPTVVFYRLHNIRM